MGNSVAVHLALDEDAEMDEDYQRDFDDYNYEPPQVEDDDGGSGDSDNLRDLVRLLVDKMDFTSEELEEAVGAIPEPTAGLPDYGTTIPEAIAVCSYDK